MNKLSMKKCNDDTTINVDSLYPKLTDETMRSKVLEEAKKCVCQDRNVQYGNPEDNFQVIANYWNAFLEQKTLPLKADDVAILMTLFKIGRTTTGGFKEDNYVDMAGYVACAAECAEQRAKREKEAEKYNRDLVYRSLVATGDEEAMTYQGKEFTDFYRYSNGFEATFEKDGKPILFKVAYTESTDTLTVNLDGRELAGV